MIVSGENILGRFGQALHAVLNIAKTQTANTGKYTYSYADLGDVLDECKRVCSDFKLSVVQYPGYDGDKMTVTTAIIDEEGETILFPPMGMKLPNDAQAIGSALTYARRYSLLTIFGIAPEDDDGAAATKEIKSTEHGGYRSGAEERILATIADLDDDVAKEVRDSFRARFGMGLSDLPVARHAEALEFVIEEAADAKFRAGEAE